MAFPTIPIVADGHILFSNVVGNGTRTFPNLSSLTKSSGDLLIAIIVAHMSSSGAGVPGGTVFSTWGGGFTEFCDQMTTNSSTMAIGMAWKVSTGSEAGTFTVAQAATITGGASMCLMAIPNGYTAAAPKKTNIVNGTSAGADPAALTPSGGQLDYLWIAVSGNSEVSATGTWTAHASGPANYTGYLDAATPDTSTVGECEVAVAFRQLAASSEDVGAFTSDFSNAKNSAILVAVRPQPLTFTKAGFAKENG